MSIEIITELETKVDVIIQNLELLRQHNSRLKGEVEEKSAKISAIEGENVVLKKELDSLKADALEQRQKLKAAADKIQILISKIEAS